MREDESGDSEDGEDDELPCAIGGRSKAETVSHEARKVQWGVHSIDKMQCNKNVISDLQRELGRWTSKSDRK